MHCIILLLFIVVTWEGSRVVIVSSFFIRSYTETIVVALQIIMNVFLSFFFSHNAKKILIYSANCHSQQLQNNPSAWTILIGFTLSMPFSFFSILHVALLLNIFHAKKRKKIKIVIQVIIFHCWCFCMLCVSLQRLHFKWKSWAKTKVERNACSR